MKKLRMETKDQTQANIEQIAELFPNVITEMKDEDGQLKKGINFERLKQELSGDVIDGEECYDFTWVGKKSAMIEANTKIRKTLRPVMEESKDWETTENLYIEGDNLDALKLLQESYLNSVKMIYIDPPYNTGKDFIYRDDFVMCEEEYEEGIHLYDDEENRLFRNTQSNGRFHSDWCSMLYSRLKLARNLLSGDGLLFISISDHEGHNLRKLCDEIFGEENFVVTFIWATEGHTDNQYDVKVNHEYIYVYAKNKDHFELGYVIDPNTREESNLWKGFAENSITKNGPANPVSVVELPKGFPCKIDKLVINANVPHKGFFEDVQEHGYISRTITDKYGVTYPVRMDEMIVENSVLTHSVQVLSGWANVNKLRAFIANGCKPLVEPDGSELSFFLSERGVIYYHRERNKARNILSVLRNMGTTEQMRSELERQNVYFTYPKPRQLLHYLISVGLRDSRGTVLDFFAGSSTTAHAVMQLNADDGGNRKFIMVQLPEETEEKSEAYKAGYRTISDIGKERIRRSGEKIKNEVEESNSKLKKGEETKKVPDIGFRVLKVDSTNMNDVYYAANDVTQDLLTRMESNVKDDRTDLDLLYGVLVDWGLPLSLSHEMESIDGVTVHTVDEGSLIACFAEDISESVVREIAKRQPLRVVFRDSSFASSPGKINVTEIFKLLSPNTSVRVI